MLDKSVFNNLYWFLKLEFENDSNEEEVRKYFGAIGDELIEMGEEESPEATQDILSSIELR